MPQKDAAVAPPVVGWLRLEGLALGTIGAVLYARSGASWLLFGLLWLVPDLSFLGYLAGPRFGSYCYNAVHSYIGPVALALVALGLSKPQLLPFVFLWCNHIGVDRLLGYGLKYPSAFGATHLKRLGRRPATG